MDSIPHWLEKRAYLSPEKTALQLQNGNIISFKQLRNSAIAFAEHLKGVGIQKGDHIALLANNSQEMVVAIHATSYIGATLVLLNTRLTTKELIFQLEDATCKLLIFDAELETVSQEIQSCGLNIAHYSLKDIKEKKREAFEFVKEFKLQDTFTIIYTSGTTGSPKGVNLTYGNHWWSAISSALNLGITECDRWLATLPLFHVGGLSILVRSLVYGMPVHLHRKFSAEAIHKAIMEEKVTTVSVVAVMLEQLLDKLGDEHYPESFRCMLLGGGPAPKSLLDDCKEKGVPVFQTYGMTETASQIATLNAEDALRKLGSAGKPLFSANLYIQKNGKEVSENEIGEIMVKGPMVTPGYFNRLEANEQTFHDSWFATGDLGYFDNEGFLFVVDRRNDLIISGGENVYPAEIESVIKGLLAVQDVGVVGIEDKKWGAVPVAFIVKKKGTKLDAKDILSYCQSYLARYKVPKFIHFIDELPRNASNKVLRRELINRLNTEGE